jgi:hypothetical protein
VPLLGRFEAFSFQLIFNALFIIQKIFENSYLLRSRSVFSDFRVFVIVVVRRFVLQTFYFVLFLLVCCSNYIYCLFRV